MNSPDKRDSIVHSENNDHDQDTPASPVLQKPATKHIKWSPENELIMVEWCDIAQCYKWLHTRCHKKLAALHAWFTIPAIALSTISGTASFAQTSLPLDAQPYAPMAIGTINILIGISTTIQQYLKISELNELHRVSGLLWDKFSRNIRIELAKDPDERMDAGHFLKICRQEFDRLMETSPSIDQAVILEFNRTFRGRETDAQKQEFMKQQQRRFEELRKPDICDIIISANESRHTWYKDPVRITRMKSEMALDLGPDVVVDIENPEPPSAREPMTLMIPAVQNFVDILKSRKQEEEAKQQRSERMSRLRQGTIALATKIKHQNGLIQDYISTIETTLGRPPTADEIEQNMREVVDTDILAKFLREYSESGGGGEPNSTYPSTNTSMRTPNTPNTVDLLDMDTTPTGEASV